MIMETKRPVLHPWKEVDAAMLSIALSVLTVLFMVIPSHSASAAGSDGYVREKGMTVRVGAGAPSNSYIGAGYRFGPHFSIAAEAFSYSGLTTITGVVDARYHILDNVFSPFVAARIGYGKLGMTMEYRPCRNALGSLTAGLGWRGFDLGAGIIYDPFHKLQFISDISWTYCFKSRRH